MALEEYQKKRSFTKTPEPVGGKPEDERLHFVVQKHHASHLHYDFRLELKGVLKSWAVPKGPSMSPEDNRLAQAVEDHPYDYKDFEGIIPAGQYGAGTVIIWDQGTYEPVEKFKTKREQEHYLMSSYYKGHLTITLRGNKLKGKFELVRKPERGENSWILSKTDDRYKLKSDIRKRERSVVSGMTLEEMAANKHALQWQSNRRNSNAAAEPPLSVLALLKKGKESVLTRPLDPMLATLATKPFDDDDWLFEVKFDGYRIQAHLIAGNARLYSRNHLDYTSKYTRVSNELSKIGREVVLDGEVILLNKKGHPDYDALQSYNGNGDLVYYAFDLLWLDGYDITGLPLAERKEVLKAILPESDILRYSLEFDRGTALFELVKKQELEGIVAKRRGSIYKPGKRSTDWIKIPTRKIEEFVVGAWTESEKGKGFRSLVFGNFQDGKLVYVGHAGHGFKDKEREEILRRLQKLEVSESPFSGEVTTSTKVHWIRPELVISVEFATYTKSGSIRKPATFKGFRNDKDPKEVVAEIPWSEAKEQQQVQTAQRPKVSEKITPAGTAAASNWPDIEKLEVTSRNVLPVGSETVTVTNIEKILWSKPAVTKADLIRYYISVQHYILPYLRNRPLSLHLKPFGPTAPGLYIKDMEGREPAFAETFRMPRKHAKNGKRPIIDYLVCQNLPTLIYIINLGAIDLNPWSSCSATFERPDYITIDLDPSDEDFAKAVDTALAAKELFDELGLQSAVKTSGKTGLHLLLPCRNFTFPQTRTIGENICDEIHARVKGITTRERTVAKRGNLLYVDDSQNDLSDTIASAYSVRPYHLPTVSTPLEWKEVNNRLHPEEFTLETIPSRLKKKGDLFKGIFDETKARKNTSILNGFL